MTFPQTVLRKKHCILMSSRLKLFSMQNRPAKITHQLLSTLLGKEYLSGQLPIRSLGMIKVVSISPSLTSFLYFLLRRRRKSILSRPHLFQPFPDEPASTIHPDQSSNISLGGERSRISAAAPFSSSDCENVRLNVNSKGVGRAVTNLAVDHELWLWFCEQTSKKRKPKSKEVSCSSS